MKSLKLCLLAITAFVVSSGIRVQSAEIAVNQGEISERLSGHKMATIDAINQSDIICVAKVLHIGKGSNKTAGLTAFHGTQLEVTQAIRGLLQSPILVTIFAAEKTRTDINEEEHPPKLNGSYIFFIQRQSGWNVVLKILPDQNDNLNLVKQLVIQVNK